MNLAYTLANNKIGSNNASIADTADIITLTVGSCGEPVSDLGTVTNTINLNVTESTYFKVVAQSQAINVNLIDYNNVDFFRSITFILKITTTEFNSYFVFSGSPLIEPFGGSNPPIFEIPGTYHILFTYEAGESFYYGKAGSY